MTKKNYTDYFLYDGVIVDGETGELLTEKEYHENFTDSMKKKIDDYNNSCREVGVYPKLEIRKIKQTQQACVQIKGKYHFNKVFRMDMKELMLKGNLSKDELAVIGFYQNFISFPNNEIIVNSEYLTIEELAKLMGISRTLFTRAIKTLEMRQIIKVIKKHKEPPMIYFNPFLISTGGVISFDTFRLFQNSIYNPKDYLEDENE